VRPMVPRLAFPSAALCSPAGQTGSVLSAQSLVGRSRPAFARPTVRGFRSRADGSQLHGCATVAKHSSVRFPQCAGTCVSGPFTIYNAPLVAFASANTTCTSHKMSLADISSIFEPNGESDTLSGGHPRTFAPSSLQSNFSCALGYSSMYATLLDHVRQLSCSIQARAARATSLQLRPHDSQCCRADNKLMLAAQTAIQACVGTNAQVSQRYPDLDCLSCKRDCIRRPGHKCSAMHLCALHRLSSLRTCPCMRECIFQFAVASHIWLLRTNLLSDRSLTCFFFLLQVWFDTTLTATDTPATCNAFMVTNQPTAGTTAANGRRLAGATPLILLASSVPAGCTAKLPVLCM